MGTFSGVLHSCGHRKVLTWHVPNPCGRRQSLLLFCLKKKITTSFTEYFDAVSVPCLKHTGRVMGRCVNWWLGFVGFHPHHEYYLVGIFAAFFYLNSKSLLFSHHSLDFFPWRYGATNLCNTFIVAFFFLTTNSAPPLVQTIL